MNNILFIGKEGDHFSDIASIYLQELFSDVEICKSSKKVQIPESCYEWKGDYIFSYLSQWIIPQEILENASIAALNWHPGPPSYPGIGCTNFAIYNEEKQFGITCHHMNPKVDTGLIVDVKYFPIIENETVLSLTYKSYATIFNSFVEIINLIKENRVLPSSSEKWQRKPYKRKQLNDLCKLSLDMSKEEIEKRIKATKYITHWSYFEINGRKFKLSEE